MYVLDIFHLPYSMYMYIWSKWKTTLLGPLKLITFTLVAYSSLSKQGLVHNHSCEYEFNLYVKEILLLHERMGTKTRVEKEAYDNLEIAYCSVSLKVTWLQVKKSPFDNL